MVEQRTLAPLMEVQILRLVPKGIQMNIFYGFNEKEISLDEVLLHIPNGWHGIVTKLIQDLQAMGWDGKLIQIKEKFGGLRFYTKCDSLHERISEAEVE